MRGFDQGLGWGTWGYGRYSDKLGGEGKDAETEGDGGIEEDIFQH